MKYISIKIIILLILYSSYCFGSLENDSCVIKSYCKINYGVKSIIYNSVTQIINKYKSTGLPYNDRKIELYFCKNNEEFLTKTRNMKGFNGSTNGNVIIFQNINILLQKKVLITTIKHEVIHFLVKDFKFPKWLEESLAIGLSNSVINYDFLGFNNYKQLSKILPEIEKKVKYTNSDYRFLGELFIFLSPFISQNINFYDLRERNAVQILETLKNKKISELQKCWVKYINEKSYKQ